MPSGIRAGGSTHNLPNRAEIAEVGQSFEAVAKKSSGQQFAMVESRKYTVIYLFRVP